MSFFGKIMDRIFHRRPAQAPDAPRPAPQAAPAQAPTAAAPAPAQPAAPVDVEAVLIELAAEKDGGGNWRTSIVDLLKLLDLDSSLTARKALGEELGSGPAPTAAPNRTSPCTRRSCASWRKTAARFPPACGTEAVMSHDPAAVVRASYQAYVDKDRAALEAVIASDFHFTSPLDNRLDRAAYFKRCWPNSKTISAFDEVYLVVDGERVFVTYEGRSARGRFRNTEILTVRDGRIIEAEVYFGWSIPHPAPSGGFTDPQ